jgi:hypothetical protein
MRVCETECGTVRAHGGVTVCARRCISLRAGRALINQQASNSATVCQSMMATSHHPNHMWRPVVPINSTIFVGYNYGMANRDAPDPTRPRTHLVLIATLVVACLTVWSTIICEIQHVTPPARRG